MQVLIEAQPEVIAIWWFYMGREDSYTDLSGRGGDLITSLNNRWGFFFFLNLVFLDVFPKYYLCRL